MGKKTTKITAGICGLAVMAGVMTMTTPAAHATVFLPQGVENIVEDNDQQQIIETFNGINSFRASKGLSPVKFSVPISKISDRWSYHMASTDMFYHNPDYISGAPSNWTGASEIIAARDDRWGQGLVQQWIASPSHNSIMSNPKYNTMGLGIAFTDMTKPADPDAIRHGMYGTANLFQYGFTPEGTYNHPADYFAGKPPLPVTQPAPANARVTPANPTFDHTKQTFTIPSSAGTRYFVNGSPVTAGIHPVPAGTDVKVSVTASPASGYEFTAGAITSWSAIFRQSPSIISVTPLAPSFNYSLRTYTIPTTTGVDYFVNGAKTIAGKYPGSKTVTITATAQSGYSISGTSSWTKVFHVVKGGDMLAVDSNGVLWNYGNSAIAGRKTLFSSGWSTAKKVFVADWNADGLQDVVTQWNSGKLTVHYGNKTGGLNASQTIGTGWESYEIVIGKYARADKYPTIIAKDTAGYLWQYSNPTGSTVGTRIKKGSGWKNLQVHLLDWDKDGNMDIIAKNTSGSLLLYRTDGYGKFKSETRKVIGTGWSGFQIHSIRGYTSSSSQGLLAKDANGNLYYYGTGTGTWITRISEGKGWVPMKIASS